MSALISAEDPNASLFGRFGKDGGQDARSGDGSRVFQAKYHEAASSAKAIADARKEAAKLAEYRQPGHGRYEQWKGVTHWRLVTNAAFNPTDFQTWVTDIVPRFAALGLHADYWERANLDALLDKHREVDRAFFENETRAMLSLAEIRERLPSQEPFVQRPELGAFFGRDVELTQIRDFLVSNELFLVIHGAGGIGKTRLLLEAGEQLANEGSWQVLWANIASMSSTGTWFDAIVPERPTLLLVDEPNDEHLLQQLSEQLGGRIGRTTQWKVVVAVRSPKDPVVRFLFGPRMKPRVRALNIPALPLAAAEAMCIDLLKSGPLVQWSDERRENVAKALAQRFSRYPVWLTLAVHVFEQRGELSAVPETAQKLADSYLEEIVGRQQQYSPEQVLAILRWVALLGTVNRNDDTPIKVIGEGTGIADGDNVRNRLASLVARRALVERGARNRLVELKPDVFRDHVLLEWLSVNIGYGEAPVVASKDAKGLVAAVRDAAIQGNLSATGRSILQSLARTERLLQLTGSKVPLLDEFFGGIAHAISSMAASRRIALAETLVTVAPFRPVETASVVSALRLSAAASETIETTFRTRTITHDHVLLELAWPVFHAATAAATPDAQRAVLREMCELVDAEAALSSRLPHGLPNDGKRAAALLERTVEGGPEFWGDFDDTAREHAEIVLARISATSPTTGDRALLKALVQPIVAMERRQTWSDEHAVHMRSYSISPAHPAWVTREVVIARIKGILAADGTPTATRVALWEIFAEAHRSTNQCRDCGVDTLEREYRGHLLADLSWAHEVLSARKTELEVIAAARDVWDWHYRFETDEELKSAASRLEAIYTADDVAREFEPLLARDDWRERDTRMAAKAAELAQANTPEDIESFLERAIRFVGSETDLRQFMGVAWNLGEHAPHRPVVQGFIAKTLGKPTMSPCTDFGTLTAVGWAAHLRRSGAYAEAHKIVVDLLVLCANDEQRANLLLQMYGRVPRLRDAADPTHQEYDLLRSYAHLFQKVGRAPEFVAAIALTLHHDWPRLRTLIEHALDDTPPEQITRALASLIDAVYWAVSDSESTSTPPALGAWLLEQILRLPDVGDLGDNVEWHLNEVLNKVGRPSVVWLPAALKKRIALEAHAGAERYRAVSHHGRLSKYIARIADSDATNGEVRHAVESLLDLGTDKGSVGYLLPTLLRDVDPEGLVVPETVARRASVAATPKDLRRLARLGGAYALGSLPWKIIAKPVLVRAAAARADEQRSLFGALWDRGIRSYSASLGEVPLFFRSAVDSARNELAAEVDVDFRPFWEWRLAIAEAELREEEERSKEERGE